MNNTYIKIKLIPSILSNFLPVLRKVIKINAEINIKIEDIKKGVN